MMLQAHIINDSHNACLRCLQQHPVACSSGVFTITSPQNCHWVWHIHLVASACTFQLLLPEIAFDPPWKDGIDQLWQDASPDIRAAFIMDQAYPILQDIETITATTLTIERAERIADNNALTPTLYGIWTNKKKATVPVACIIEENQRQAFNAVIKRFPPQNTTTAAAITIHATILYGIVNATIEELAQWQDGDILFFDQETAPQQLALCLQTQDRMLALHVKKTAHNTLVIGHITTIPLVEKTLCLRCTSPPFPIDSRKLTHPSDSVSADIPLPSMPNHIELVYNTQCLAFGHGITIEKKRGIRLTKIPTPFEQLSAQLQNEAR